MVTIVVLIILATISIKAVFGENGLIKRAEAAKRLHEQGVTYEQEEFGNLTNKVEELLGEKKDEELKGWKLADKDIKSPFYPGNYYNNCYIHESKKYGEKIKGIKIVVRDCQLEGGGEYDYGLFLNSDKKEVLRLMVDFTGEFCIRGNCFDFYFFSDSTVTRRGYVFDIYITENEDIVLDEKPVEKNRYYFCDIESRIEESTIKLSKNTKPKITINTIPYKKDENIWKIVEEETIDVNSKLTISNINGDVLYSQDILNKQLDLTPDIENYPEEIVIKLERKDVDNISSHIRINIDYTS